MCSILKILQATELPAFYSFLFMIFRMSTQSKVMLDTNVYDKIALKDEQLIPEIISSQKITVYGCRVIREELRAIPKGEKVGSRNLRVMLLRTCDLLVKKHDLPVEDIAEYVAKEYTAEYSGNKPKKDLYSDFLIVAVASLKDLDIVCTDDSKTMSSTDTVEAYKKVNERNGLRTPQFIPYASFKKLV